MKYCPYCGADVIGSSAFFCGECGRKLPLNKQKEKQNGDLKKISFVDCKKKIKSKKANSISDSKFQSEGYDGYYDDLFPIDGNVQIRGNKSLLKRIIILTLAVVVVLILCVVLMYLH